MKKIIIATILAALLCTQAQAQYRLSTGVLPSGVELIQADKISENTVRIYFSWTSAQDNYGFDIDDDACITLPGSFRRYKLVGAGNIPLTSDGSYAVALKAGDSIHFLLDFEAFPLDSPFSITDDSENESNLSCSGLLLENAGLKAINTDDFVRSKPSLLKGEYSENGATYSFWNYDGMALIAKFVKTYDDTHLFYIYLNIVNNSGSSISFDPKDVLVEHENKNGRRNALKVFNATEYKKRMDFENAFNKLGVIATAIGTVESVGNTLTGGQFFSSRGIFDNPVSNYVGFMNSKQNLEKFTQMMDSIQQEYLEAGTVESRNYYGGYLCLNEKKNGLYRITVPLMGQNFTFTVEE